MLILALLSQYACCHMGFLIVRIVENITVAEGGAGTDRQTERRKRRKYIWITLFQPYNLPNTYLFTLPTLL